MHYKWVNGSLLTGTASLTLPTKSQLTAQNNTADELNFKIITGERYLDVVSF